MADNETPPPSSNQQCSDTTTTVTTGTSTEMTSNSSKINSLLSPEAEVSTDFVDDQSLPPQIGMMGHLIENNSLAHQLHMRIMKSKASILNGDRPSGAAGGLCFVNNTYVCSSSPPFQMTVSTQTGQESPDTVFTTEKISVDKHCYECKVRYRDPKPQDLVMYLHAWKYKVSDDDGGDESSSSVLLVTTTCCTCCVLVYLEGYLSLLVSWDRMGCVKGCAPSQSRGYPELKA